MGSLQREELGGIREEMANIRQRTIKLRCDYNTLLELEGSIEYAKSKATYAVNTRHWRCEEDIVIPLSAILIIDGSDE